MMEKSHEIKITGFTNPNQFVEHWSQFYSYGNEYKYRDNIKSVLIDRDSFINLFKWKNGTGDKISQSKMKTIDRFWSNIHVLRELKNEFSWDKFESNFNPNKGPNIWKLFLLHLIEPNLHPLFDQHVYRFYQFHKNGQILEIPSNSSKRYNFYKNEYYDWFNRIKDDYHLNPKKMDESFFTFGQFLKGMNSDSIEIISS